MQLFRHHFGKWDITFPQALALSVLGQEGSMPISKLAEKTGSANSTISGIVDRLEALGLVRRSRSELDHRVIYVDVTDKYQKVYSAANVSVEEYFSALLGTLEPEELAQVSQGLALLDKALTRGDPQES